MRFGTTSVGAPSGSFVAITPAAGAIFNLNTVAGSQNAASAFETILDGLNLGAVYGASIVGTAGAANKAVAELNNPAASGKLVYVYSLDVFVPVAMAVNLFVAGTSLAPAGTGFNLRVGVAVGVAKVGGGNQLATTGSLVYTTPTLAINTTFFIPLPYLVALPAGTNIQLQGQTVNQAFTCNVRWIELSQ